MGINHELDNNSTSNINITGYNRKRSLIIMKEKAEWNSFYDKLPTETELILVCTVHPDPEVGKFITMNRYSNDGCILMLVDSGSPKICHVEDIKNISLWKSIIEPETSLWVSFWDKLTNKSKKELK